MSDKSESATVSLKEKMPSAISTFILVIGGLTTAAFALGTSNHVAGAVSAAATAVGTAFMAWMFWYSRLGPEGGDAE